jgi:hypothetical protein
MHARLAVQSTEFAARVEAEFQARDSRAFYDGSTAGHDSPPWTLPMTSSAQAPIEKLAALQGEASSLLIFVATWDGCRRRTL